MKLWNSGFLLHTVQPKLKFISPGKTLGLQLCINEGKKRKQSSTLPDGESADILILWRFVVL